MIFKKKNNHIIIIILLLTIVLSCSKSITLQNKSCSKIPPETAGINAALKHYNKDGVICVCLIPTWCGESNRKFLGDSCNCMISAELNRYGIRTKRQVLDFGIENNFYDIRYWSSYKTTMDSLINIEFGVNFIDSLCQTTKIN